MAEKSIAKMGVKPVVTSDIVKQQKELEEQRRKIQEQKDEVMFYLNCQNLGYLTFFNSTAITYRFVSIMRHLLYHTLALVHFFPNASSFYS